MKSDKQLAYDVQSAIHDEPMMVTADISALASGGVVTLSGVAAHFGMKSEAVSIVRSVIGVQRVVDDIEVRLHLSSQRSDHEIVAAITEALKNSWKFSIEHLSFEVKLGEVLLSGVLQWDFQRKAAYAAIMNLVGITGVNDLMQIAPCKVNSAIEPEIERRIARSLIYSKELRIDVHGQVVVLAGKVETADQSVEAEKLCWNVAGVVSVTNDLTIEPRSEAERKYAL